MPLENFVVAVNFFRDCSLRDLRWPGTEAHAGALRLYVALFFKQADDGIGRVRVELGAVRFFEATNISRELDRGDLHAEAEAQVGDFVFAGEFRRADFSLDAAFAEAAGNQAPSHIFQMT